MPDDAIFIGGGDGPVELPLRYANRHGLLAGATGTGKTVTVQILAEEFSRAGVPVFVADVKGDLAGLAVAGSDKPFLRDRAEKIGLADYGLRSTPVTFWDLYGEKGHHLRATVSEMGPILMARILELNDTQEGVLGIVYRVSDDEGLPLLDLKDLRALLRHVGERRTELSLAYGHIAPATIAAIQRRLLQLEDQAGEAFFGEPKINLNDFIRHVDGSGVVNVLAADRLMMTPKLYAAFLLWLLSELFEELPEIGDPQRPKLVFFFDEAHLLFDDAPAALLDRIEQVVRLIRSKGVGVYFATQNPMDLPDSVSSQLANRLVHGLRAYTPRERRVVKAVAETFRPNPSFEAEQVLTELGIGEALVSTLQSKGVPSPVERTLIRPPRSRMGAISDAERRAAIARDGLGAHYDVPLDRRSAHEILAQRTASQTREDAQRERPSAKRPAPRRSRRMSPAERAASQAIRTGTSVLVRELVRGLLGSFKRRR
jgi:DNA helicase HerA-like ATPase